MHATDWVIFGGTGDLSRNRRLGLALRHASPASKQLLADLSAGVTSIVKLVIRLAPLGIFGLVAATLAESGMGALLDYLHLLLVLVGCMLFVALVVNPLIVFGKIRRNPYPLVLTCLRESGLTAFFTRSSAANIPVNLQLCQRLGLQQETYSVSIPLGATINMAGAAITISVLTLAAVHTLGIAVDLPTALLLSLLASISACGASGVAGGSLLLIPLACSLFGIPNEVAMQVVAVGFIIGIVRLSPNWLAGRLAYGYVEFVRNVPLLLQIFIWAAIFQYLPQVRDAHSVWDIAFLSNRGIELPTPVADALLWSVVFALVIGIAGAIMVARWASIRQATTGQTFPAGTVGAALIIGLPILAFLATGMPLDFTMPELKGFNFAGGINIPPSFIALWLALTFYTAAFIAEIVRAGIEAVSHGQTEAAYSLGLRPGRTLRLIIIPQALRVIVPPLTSQYLNLTKNSSLGVAIAYPELVSVFAGTTLNQTGRAIEILFITMMVYLSISISISLFMNWYNRRIALVER